MPYVLGIDVGSSRTRAAVSRRTPTGWSDPVPVVDLPTVVHLAPDGTALVGDEAERHANADPSRIARGFTARIGDDVPLVLGGTLCTAPELTAVVLRYVVDRVAAAEDGPADRLVVPHPADWGEHRTALLRHELARQDLTDVTLLPEPVAIAEAHPAAVRDGGLLATYSLGAATAAAALLRRTSDGFELLAHASAGVDLAGNGFDDAIMDCVRAQVGSALDQLDPTEPQAWLAMAQLRGGCAAAKEALSAHPEVIVPVALPAGPVDARITRVDFDRIIQPAVRAGADLVTRVVRSADGDVTAIVPAGGSARIPLVTAVLSTAGRIVGGDPSVAVVVGATLAARRLLVGAAPDVAPARDGLAHTEVIERSAIELYGGGFDPVAIDDEFGETPPPRPPVDVTPLDLPARGLNRLLPGVRPAVLTVSTLVVVAIGVVLTFLIESGSGNHPNPTNPLHLGPAQPAADQSVVGTTTTR